MAEVIRVQRRRAHEPRKLDAPARPQLSRREEQIRRFVLAEFAEARRRRA